MRHFTQVRNQTKCHGRIAAAPVFFVAGCDDDGLRGFGGLSTMGGLAAFLFACFHLFHAGVPAASMRSVKMVDDSLSSIVKLFLDPSPENLSTFSDENLD
jgi:hypothetical protein